jgi:HK97 family phage major capsid protein
MNVIEMRQKRANLIEQAREVLNRASTENRNLGADEEQQYDRIMADVDKLKNEIEREDKLQNIEKELGNSLSSPILQEPGNKKEDVPLRASKEYREAFWNAQIKGRNTLDAEQHRMLMAPEIRNLAIGTDAAGGFLVPDEFERQLLQIIEAENVFRGLATIITTGSGTREIPVEADYGTATWLGENATFTESDATFSQKTLNAYKLGTLIKVSEELMNDAFFNVSNYIAGAFGRRFGRAEEAAFINGDGVNKPRGVLLDASAGKTGATGQTTSVTADDLIDVYHALKRPYRSKADWLLADSTVKAIRKLKDADGQYLWQPGIAAGQPDRILNRPVVVSDEVPAMAASAKSILFGDYSHYWVADRTGRTMQRLDELYAASGQVGFRMYSRMDGKLIRNDAVVTYQNSAT